MRDIRLSLGHNARMSPGPWSFHQYRYGLTNVVTDADGRVLAVNVRDENGPMIAAGPGLLRELTLIAAGAQHPQHIAQRALEDFGERETALLTALAPAETRVALTRRGTPCARRG